MIEFLPPNFAAYVVMTIFVCLTPGPAVLFVVSQAGWRGVRAGIAAAFGIAAANTLYFALTAAGLAAALAAIPAAFTIIKLAGAAYLIWLGVTAIAGSFKPQTATAPDVVSSARSFRDAIIVQLSNPKAILFFLALLPQFIDPARSVAAQTFFLALAGCVIELIVLSAYAALGAALTARLAAPGVKPWFDRGVGLIFLCLAAATLFLKA